MKFFRTYYKKIAALLFIAFILFQIVQYAPPLYKKAYNFFVEYITHKQILVLAETSIRTEIVDTPAKRILGLSGRESLPEGTGMLFVFEKPDLHGFWMKDMNFSIDIIWFNEYSEVVHIVENASPKSYPETFMPPTPSMYVLEVPAGFASEHNIKLGDIIDF